MKRMGTIREGEDQWIGVRKIGSEERIDKRKIAAEPMKKPKE